MEEKYLEEIKKKHFIKLYNDTKVHFILYHPSTNHAITD